MYRFMFDMYPYVPDPEGQYTLQSINRPDSEVMFLEATTDPSAVFAHLGRMVMEANPDIPDLGQEVNLIFEDANGNQKGVTYVGVCGDYSMKLWVQRPSWLRQKFGKISRREPNATIGGQLARF